MRVRAQPEEAAERGGQAVQVQEGTLTGGQAAAEQGGPIITVGAAVAELVRVELRQSEETEQQRLPKQDLREERGVLPRAEERERQAEALEETEQFGQTLLLWQLQARAAVAAAEREELIPQ